VSKNIHHDTATTQQPHGIHIHKDLKESLDIKVVSTEFILENQKHTLNLIDGFSEK